MYQIFKKYFASFAKIPKTGTPSLHIKSLTPLLSKYSRWSLDFPSRNSCLYSFWRYGSIHSICMVDLISHLIDLRSNQSGKQIQLDDRERMMEKIACELICIKCYVYVCTYVCLLLNDCQLAIHMYTITLFFVRKYITLITSSMYFKMA